MRVNVSLKLNHEVSKQLTQACDRAMDRTSLAVLDDIKTRAVVPHDTGQLAFGSEQYRSGYVEKINEMVYAIIYNTPYARRWYFNVEGAKFQKTKSINATDHWMDYYLDGEGMQWVIDTYSHFLKEESGGIIQ